MSTRATNDPDHDHDTAQPGQALLAQLLRAGHRVRVTARGISMLPTIGDGDRVLLEPLPHNTARRGDIVFVQRADHSYALHRIVRMFADGRLQTRGDANWRLDDAVQAEAVLGRVQSESRKNNCEALTRSVGVWVRLACSWAHYRVTNLRSKLRRTATTIR